MRIRLILTLVLALGAPAAFAQSTAPATQPKLDPKISVTQHTLDVAGKPFNYRATAGYLPAKDDAGKEKANFFFIAYEADRPATADPATRPVTFVFNGGPGAASVWLHLGTAGPRRLELGPEGQVNQSPGKLIDNDSTWLAASDLVFIDPVGTGYSRVAPGENAQQFYGVREDVAAVADFIRLYATRYERWTSPKFLAGESYGTTRAAALSEHLLDRHGIALSGIVLISSVLDFQTISFGGGNDLPYAVYLPTYAATSLSHKKLAPELQGDFDKTLKEVEAFATGDYLTALAQGSSLPADQRKAVVAKLAQYTALPPAFIEKANLRITPGQYRKMLLEDKRQIIGRFDTTITGLDPEPANTHADYDPSLSLYLPAYSAGINDLARRRLRFESDLTYEVLSDRVNPWNWGQGGNGYLYVADELRSAMVKNPRMKVIIASGYFDLATPYAATSYTINKLNLSKELAANITQTHYAGGHMMYHHADALKKLNADILAFIRSSADLKPAP